MTRLLLTTTASLLLLSGAAFAQTSSTTKPQTPNGHTTESGTSATKMSDSQIEQNLEKQGYSNVKVTKHVLDRVQVSASKNGVNHTLSVDPTTGKVMQ